MYLSQDPLDMLCKDCMIYVIIRVVARLIHTV